MRVIVSHTWRVRLSALFLALCLVFALSVSSAHSHDHDKNDTGQSSFDCIACMMVSDLDDADMPAGICIPLEGTKLTALPQACHKSTLPKAVRVNARGPPVYI